MNPEGKTLNIGNSSDFRLDSELSDISRTLGSEHSDISRTLGSEHSDISRTLGSEHSDISSTLRSENSDTELLVTLLLCFIDS